MGKETVQTQNEMIVHLPDIEGEFTAENNWRGQVSGYLCLRCKHPLVTGETVCRGCGRDFPKPTLSVAAVSALRPEMRPQFSLGRTTPAEWQGTLARRKTSRFR